MPRWLQVFTTTESREQAGVISRALVERRLAACVQVTGPVQSTYWWDGKVESGEEWLLLVKTSAELFPQVEAAIRDLHSYDVPEIIAVPIGAGSAAYLSWLEDELGGEPV